MFVFCCKNQLSCVAGLWCADRAALYALVEVEKLKKKTAYDRHYLLLCMIFTVMARIRCVIG